MSSPQNRGLDPRRDVSCGYGQHCKLCAGNHDSGMCCMSMPSVDSGLDAASQMSPYGSPNGRSLKQPHSPCQSPMANICESTAHMVTPIVTSTPTHQSAPHSRMSPFTGGQESKTNLIVNYLPQNYTQDQLRELFSSIGDIETCKLCRHRETKMSLGYGFVNFRRSSDAKRAVDSFNGLSIQTKSIKVSYARPSSNIIKNTNLYVAGIPRSITLAEIKNLFGRLGKIISARILHDKDTGLSKGVAFIRYDTRVEAERAVKHMHHFNYEGEVLTVKFASPMERPEKGIQSSSEEIMKNSSSTDVNDPNFQQAFQENFQKMILAYSPLYPRTPNRRSEMTGRTSSTSEDQQEHSSPPVPYSGRRRSSVPVFISVTNMPPDITESKVWELFGPFGAVNSIQITRRECEPSNPNEIAILFVSGTVQMPVYHDALAAICALQGTEISKGYKLRLEFQLPAMNGNSS